MKSIVKIFSACLLLATSARAADAPSPKLSGAPPVVQDSVIVDDATEKVIRAALKYLAAKQTPNGSWNAGRGEHPVAMTAHTLMAFLPPGHDPNGGADGQ